MLQHPAAGFLCPSPSMARGLYRVLYAQSACALAPVRYSSSRRIPLLHSNALRATAPAAQRCLTSSDCAAGYKCNPNNQCVECLSSADCGTCRTCSETGSCSPVSRGTSGNSCPAPQVCTGPSPPVGTANSCVQCVSDQQCSGGTPKCKPETSTCVVSTANS